jgi:hypothetical protein
MVLLMLVAVLLAVLPRPIVRRWPHGYVVLSVCLVSLPIFVVGLGALGLYMDIGRLQATLRLAGTGIWYGIFAWIYVTVSSVKAWRRSLASRPSIA